MHKETAHAGPSNNALRQENQPITPPILRRMQMIKAQTEVAQPSQNPADSYDGSMALGVEESTDEEREEQRHECLNATDEANRRVRRVQEEMLVVVCEECAEAHDQAPASGVRISIFLPSGNPPIGETIHVQRKTGEIRYQQFAIPQKPDKSAAYGRHDRGHPELGGTVSC